MTKLTPEQRKRIEENRNKAIEIQKLRRLNNRDASDNSNDIKSVAISENDLKRQKLQKDITDKNNSKRKEYNPPSINKKDYIEYDFSTMKDSKGGFINLEDQPPNPLSADSDNKTLEEWKERQRKQQIVHDLPPQLDIENAPKCFECGSVELDANFWQNFNNVRVCRRCIKEKPEKYSLLTKTECREDYLLTDPELKDTALLPRVEKPNPHGFSRMQLFCRFQVEEYSWKKWGSAEGLDQEWARREENRLSRKDKKYKKSLLEMRKKTRAEEFTRKLRNGYSLGERHIHDWSAPLSIPGKDGWILKRCIDCGVETEEIVI